MVSVSDAKQNFYAFIWHALFLAFVSTFVDVNTVLSSFILKIGGSSIHVGMITAISIGLPMITQLLFAGFLAGRPRRIGIFSLSGAFAEISYMDILGKVLPRTQRKKFLIFKQFISSSCTLGNRDTRWRYRDIYNYEFASGSG